MRSLICSALLVSGLAAWAALPVPRPAPKLEIVDDAGKHLLSDYKGKVVIVQFLLTTCPHCQVYSGILAKVYAAYKPRGIRILGAAVNDATPEMARDYAAQYAPVFPVGPLPRSTAMTFLGIPPDARAGYPQIAVVDRKGRIREQTTSNMNDVQPLQNEPYLRALIEKLLAEKP